MKKIFLIIVLFPFISFSQIYDEYRQVEVFDQNGNNLGTFSIRSDYHNAVNIAIDKYIRYLEERESRERADRAKERLAERAKELGVEADPYAVAFAEGFSRAKNNASNSGYAYWNDPNYVPYSQKKFEKALPIFNNFFNNLLSDCKNSCDDYQKFEKKAFQQKNEMIEKIKGTWQYNRKYKFIEKYTEKIKKLYKDYPKINTKKDISDKDLEIKKYNYSATKKFKNGDINNALNDINRAISIYENLSTGKKTTISSEQLYLNRGFYYTKNQEYEKSIKDYSKTLEINPNNIFAYHHRAMAKESLGDKYGAISDYSIAYELNREEDIYMSNLYQSKLKYSLGDLDGAIQGFKKSIQTHTQDAYVSLHTIYENEKRFDDAKEIEGKIVLLPNFQGQLRFLLSQLADKYEDEKYDEALKLGDRMLKISLKYDSSWLSTIYNWLGYINFSRGELYESISFFSKELELEPDDFDTKIKIVEIKFILGDKQGGCKDLNSLELNNFRTDYKEKILTFIKENCNKQ